MTHFRSPEGLTTCPTCRRHISAAARPRDTICPFCSQATPRSFRGGFLAASLLTLAACGPSDSVEAAEPVPVPVQVNEELSAPAYGLPPAVDPPPVLPETTPETPPETTPETPPEPEPSAEPEAENYQPAVPMQPMARYGLAPMRDESL